MSGALLRFKPSWLTTELLATLGIATLALFAVGVVAVPYVLTRIPADRYTRAEREPRRRRSVLAWLAWLARNVAGILLVLLGALLLVLPGQGILTIALGLMLLDFPGRARLERRLIGQRKVLAGINALRRRAGRPPLEMAHRD